jgi:RNA polymerase sigma-70 factor (ECF subfamily)
MNETDLIHAAQSGNLEAFNRLVITYQDKLFNIAAYILHDDDSAADAVQEAFILAFRGLNGCRGSSFSCWLVRILKNVCYDELRRQKRSRIIPLEPLTSEEDPIENPGWLADISQEPARLSESGELSQIIVNSLKRLRPEYRLILALVDIEGMNYAEAALAAGIPLGTVKSRLARARLNLRNELAMMRPASRRKNYPGPIGAHGAVNG